MAMKTMLSICTALILAVVLAGPAEAGCYADYKAKQGKPIKLHYGVIELSADADCANKGAAKKAIAERIAKDGWTVLNVLSIFDADGLNERKKSAGRYFLHY